jgi:signal transduction histidine kinase
VVALAVAVAASAYVTRRISRPVVALARAAGEVAAGRYQIEVPKPALGREFDVLAQSFSAMAGRLGSVETTRRRLLADLAHEMRTPVATLDAYLEGIEDGVATLDRQTSAILRDQTRRLRRLAEDMAAVSRAEEHQLDLHRMPVPPAQLLTAAVDAAADRYATARVRLELDLSPEVGEVEVDVDRFGQVLGNLLDNALRHTPSGGRVVVRLRRSRDTIAFTVSDTGEGIAAEHLPHVFERFYRVDAARDRARGGSGIGLAIVKAVVEAHGGCVRVSSDGDGRGSTLTLTLPVVTTAARSASAPMPAP